MSFKYGKKDPVASPFPEFKTYFEDAPTTLLAPQAHYGKLVNVPWQMDGNGPDPDVTIAPAGWEGAGDCVECGKAHAITTGNYLYPNLEVQLPVPTANSVIEQYAKAQGCTPAQLFADPNKYDLGEDMTTSLTNWCSNVEYGTKLAFTAPVNHKSQVDISNAIYLCGGLDIGIQIQQAQQSQFPGEWKWVPSSPTEGGHCIWLCGYTNDYVALVTWGKLILATWSFILNAIDEAHALVLPQSVAAGKSPTGLLIPKWEADLQALNAS